VAKFMAVHTLPKPASEAEAIQQAKNWPKFPPGFTWKQTYCDFDSHKFFCEWEAPSKEALAQAFKGMNMPFEAIYPVKLFDVAKVKFVA
jgi:hypothetical protein